ncbi:MAG: hypothetical protein ACK41T_10225 [Pseudobdellovibrio sp.]
MKRFLILLIMMISISTHAVTNKCGLNLQGGIDTFPWSLAQPFPWDFVQGLWQINDNTNDIIRVRVVRSDENTKHLKIDILSRLECGAIMRGKGIITASEKNVVRILLTNREGSNAMMKLAFFNPQDLKATSGMTCDSQVLAASLINIDEHAKPFQAAQFENTNMVLKKVTSSLDFYCRKR